MEPDGPQREDMAARRRAPLSATRGLYPIIDVEQCERGGLNVVSVAQALLPAAPALLQLRAKGLGSAVTLALLERLLRALDGATPLFANDRPDLAAMAGCRGVHVGQDDLPLSEVQRCFPALWVGVSTHDLGQLDAALSGDPSPPGESRGKPDYVAYGPVFETSTKLDAEAAVGIAGLQRASARCRAAQTPLVAIGGISQANVAEVAAYADLVAVIGAVMADSYAAIERKALALSALIAGVQPASLSLQGSALRGA